MGTLRNSHEAAAEEEVAGCQIKRRVHLTFEDNAFADYICERGAAMGAAERKRCDLNSRRNPADCEQQHSDNDQSFLAYASREHPADQSGHHNEQGR